MPRSKPLTETEERLLDILCAHPGTVEETAVRIGLSVDHTRSLLSEFRDHRWAEPGDGWPRVWEATKKGRRKATEFNPEVWLDEPWEE